MRWHFHAHYRNVHVVAQNGRLFHIKLTYLRRHNSEDPRIYQLAP
jgi:hypothetical protein